MVVFAVVACSLAGGPIAGVAGSATAASTGGVEVVRQAATATPTPTTVDSTSAQIAFTGWWPTRTDAAAVGGSERVGEFGGDAASFTFTGSSVALVYRQAADRGQAQVYIDNVSVGLLDQYGAAPAQRTASYAVAPGTHTIRVVVNRSKQAASTGFFVGVDAFVVNGSAPATATVTPTMTRTPVPAATNTPVATSTRAPATATPTATSATGGTTVDSTSAQIAFTGWWPTRADAAAVGGSERVGEFAGDAASFTFTGTSVALVYRQAADRGQAQVYIDNVSVGLLDQYGAAPAQRTAAYAVASGTHTIRVVVNRSKQAASTGFFVGVDAFVVNGSVPATATSTPTATPTRTPTATVVAGTPTATSTPLPAGSRRVNAPRFAGGFVPGEAAVFWYGRVTEAENYTDVRVGYTATDLWVQANVFDMRLRYDAQGRAGLLEEYDSVAVEVGAPGGTYRFVSGLSWFEGRGGYQRSSPAVAFETTSGWRGNAPNSQPGAGEDDRGWVTTFRIPFASLGLGGAPAEGAAWPLAVTTYDRDDAAGAQRGQASWSGQVRFGLPGYSPPAGAAAAGTAVIRQGLGGATVPDAAVGGGSDCGGSAAPLYFDRWGSLSYAGRPDMNVQNQGDVADWPCYSKYYVTFPLGAVPAGKRIVSARLVLHQFGGSEPASAQASVVEVSTTDAGWAEGTVTWNTAPGARENVARAVVGVFGGPIVWPGVARAWDVSRAAAAAYGAGGPLALVLYSPDEPYHSGKYFVTSNSGDWNAAGRPTLEVTWSD